MIVRRYEEGWLDQSEERLSMFRCAYWMDLEGFPEIATDSTTISIPQFNILSVDALCELMYNIRTTGRGTAT
jgi:hypothetical protein